MTAPVWRRSTKCESSACVEVADNGRSVFVRSSRNPRMVLRFDAEEWRAFTEGVRLGEFAVAVRG